MRIQLPPVEVQIMLGNIAGDLADSELAHVSDPIKKCYGTRRLEDSVYTYLSGRYKEPQLAAVHYFNQTLLRRTQNRLTVRDSAAMHGGIILVIAPPAVPIRSSNSWHLIVMPNRIGAYLFDPDETFA